MRQKLIHTSGRGVGSASSAGRLQRSDSWALCGTGAWASAIHAAVRVLDSGFPPLVSSPGCPTPWEAVPHYSKQQIQDGQRRSPAACQDERHGAAGRSDLAYILQRLSLLFQDQLKVQAQWAIQRRICGWVAGEQVRRGQIRRRCLDNRWLEYPA